MLHLLNQDEIYQKVDLESSMPNGTCVKMTDFQVIMCSCMHIVTHDIYKI